MDTMQTELYVVEVAASDGIASLVLSVADALDAERRNEGEVSECLVSQMLGGGVSRESGDVMMVH
jgi:hypothetical protein